MDRPKRRIWNFVVDQKFQVRYATLYTGLIIILHAVVTSVFTKLFMSGGPEAFVNMRRLYIFVMIGIGGTYLALILLAFTWGIVWSHRIAGPTYALKKHLVKMLEGDYSGRVHLRNTDQLVELAEEINKLTEKLEKQTRG